MTTKLAKLIVQLGPDEIRVLERIAERLAMGRKQYGELAVENDPRDWKREASEELLDGCVYLAIASLR